MTVATRLDIVATGQDKVSAVLRQVNAQLSATAEKLREAKQAGADGPDVEDLFTRSRDRRMKAAAEERRAIVLSTRAEKEAAAAKRESLSLSDKVTDRLKPATKAQEAFNKTLGLAGFLGIVTGALAGIADLIESWSSYGQAMEDVKRTQAEFDALLEKVAGQVRTKELERMTELERAIFLAKEESNKAADDYVQLQQEALKREDALRANAERQRDVQEQLAKWGGVHKGYADELRRLTAEGNQLSREKAQAEELIAKFAALATDAAKAATPEYQKHVLLLRDVAKEHANVLADIDASKADQRPFFERWKAPDQKPKGGGGGNRIQELERELLLAEAASEVDKQALEREFLIADMRKGRVSEREGELRLMIMQANQERELAEFNAGLAREVAENRERAAREGQKEQERIITLRDEVALMAAKNEQERIGLRLKQELAEIQRAQARGDVSPEVAALQVAKARTAAEKELNDILRERQVKAIEGTGGAIQKTIEDIAQYEGRLGALGGAVGDMTKVFALFEEGQASTKDAVLSGIGAFGKAAAGFGKGKKEQAWILGAFHQIEALASLAYLDFAGFARHQAVAVAAFAFAGKGGGRGGGGGSRGGGGGAQQGSSSASGSGGGSISGQLGADKREVIMVAFPNGVVYGMGSEVAKAGEQAATALDGTGMQRRRF